MLPWRLAHPGSRSGRTAAGAVGAGGDAASAQVDVCGPWAAAACVLWRLHRRDSAALFAESGLVWTALRQRGCQGQLRSRSAVAAGSSSAAVCAAAGDVGSRGLSAVASVAACWLAAAGLARCSRDAADCGHQLSVVVSSSALHRVALFDGAGSISADGDGDCAWEAARRARSATSDSAYDGDAARLSAVACPTRWIAAREAEQSLFPRTVCPHARA